MKTISCRPLQILPVSPYWQVRLEPLKSLQLHMDTYADAGNEEQSFGKDDTLWIASENGQLIRIAYFTFADQIND